MSLGAQAEQIIFANPCKIESHIEFAKLKGVKLMTFDSSEEAEKIHQIFPEAELVLRIAVEKTNAPNPMTKKFGAPCSQWEQILLTCKALNIKVRGVSFHVGSGGCEFEPYKMSIINA